MFPYGKKEEFGKNMNNPWMANWTILLLVEMTISIQLWDN